jgi:O-antigen/teichoic acid export membrane protein
MSPDTEPGEQVPVPADSGLAFASNLTKLVGATTFAQILTMLASPIVTRLYGPAAFGIYAVFLSIAGMIIPVICLRFEYAIMLPRSDEEAAPLLWVSLTISGLLALGAAPVMFLFGEEIEALFNAPGLSPWLMLIPVILWSAGIFVALNYWNTRTKKFGRLAVAQVARSITIVGTQVGAGFAGLISGGSLILSALLGYMGAALVLGGQIWREDGATLKRGLNRSLMLASIKRYRKFPLVDSWAALLTSMSESFPVFMLATFFSTAVVGAYSLCLTVLQLPLGLIGTSLGQVFFSTAAPARHAGDGVLASLVEETEIRLLMLGALPFMILAVTGQELFIFVFGAAWAEAGIYAQLLAPWIMVTFLSIPISSLFSVLEMQQYSLAQNVIVLPLRVSALAIGGFLGSPVIAIALYSALGVCYTGAVAVFLVRRSGGSVRRIFTRASGVLVYAVPILVALAIVQYMFVETPAVIALAAVVGLVSYYLVLVRRDPVIRAPILAVLRRVGVPVPCWLDL